ncbi:MAG: EAL domain-containing protein [Caulobacterales bacterium]
MQQRLTAGSPLRWLIMLTAVAITFFGIVLLTVIAYAGWSANQTAVERERTLVENALNRSIARTLDEQKSVAWWDDAITKMRKGHFDWEFLDANFGYFLTETYGHDEVYILDEKDQPVYAFMHGERLNPKIYAEHQAEVSPIVDAVRNRPTKALRDRPDLFSQNQKNYNFLKGAVNAARWSGHILLVDGKPAVVTGITILPTIDMSLMPKTPKLLVSVRYVDEDFISEIGRSLLLPELQLAPKSAKGPGVVAEQFRADDGTPAGSLNWVTKQPGEAILNLILPLTTLALIAAGFMFGFMFRSLKRASTNLAEREAGARHAARHDALSGLPNRSHFTSRLNEFLSEVDSDPARSAVVAYIDVDRFKDINDTLGHRAGDLLIKAVAARLSASLENADFLARFGGDEFAILSMPAGQDDIPGLADRIAHAFTEPFELENQHIRVTASVGLALAGRYSVSAEELMRHADIALYRAKSLGRDQAVQFSEEMAQEVEERRAIEVDLRNALHTDQLRLHYQPIVSCTSNRIEGVEALLRWSHPTRGEIGPSLFVPIAEDSGLMPVLGEWILSQAMRDSKRWPGLEIAINLSPVQIRHMDLAETLERLVAEHNVDPRKFVLEITEGVLLDSNERSQMALASARAMGFKTSLDDFGTGYSSLSYLCNFTFDKIKVDRSFVTGKAQGKVGRNIVQAIATLGRGLGLAVIAEGVETEADALMVRHLGCTEMQGYHFSRPVSADDLGAVLARFNAPETVAAADQEAFHALRRLQAGL